MFTDLVPPHDLLHEAGRVLRTGGVFLHLGTFGYNHADYENQLTGEELCALLRERGFEIRGRELVEHVPCPSVGLASVHMQAFSCVAVKR